MKENHLQRSHCWSVSDPLVCVLDSRHVKQAFIRAPAAVDRIASSPHTISDEFPVASGDAGTSQMEAHGDPGATWKPRTACQLAIASKAETMRSN
jgi:hypothetical protein